MLSCRPLPMLVLSLIVTPTMFSDARAAGLVGEPNEAIRRSVDEASDELLGQIDRLFADANAAQAFLQRAQTAEAHQALTTAYVEAAVAALEPNEVAELGRQVTLAGLDRVDGLSEAAAEAIAKKINGTGFATVTIEIHHAAVQEALAKLKDELKDRRNETPADIEVQATIGRAAIALLAHDVAAKVGEADPWVIGQAMADTLRTHLAHQLEN